MENCKNCGAEKHGKGCEYCGTGMEKVRKPKKLTKKQKFWLVLLYCFAPFSLILFFRNSKDDSDTDRTLSRVH